MRSDLPAGHLADQTASMPLLELGSCGSVVQNCNISQKFARFHRTGLTFIYNRCENTPTVCFQRRRGGTGYAP